MTERTAVVCGSGIGGMAAAVSLRGVGFRVTVVEQAPVLSEVGAGLQLGPNAISVLYRLGLHDEVDKIGLMTQESIKRRWQDGTIIYKTNLGAAARKQHGSPYVQVHRADLHDLLRSAACDPSRDGYPVEIVTDTRITDLQGIDSDSPGVISSDGRTFSADLVIGADGIRSTVRKSMGIAGRIQSSGDMAFRFLLDAEKIKSDPVTKFLCDWQGANVWLGPERHVVMYPIRSFKNINVVAVVPEIAAVVDEGSCKMPKEDMLEQFADWDERVVRALTTAEDNLLAWALNHLEPLESWTSGRVALLGDACHAMVPYVSQGASQAILDALVLAETLDEYGEMDVPQALKVYEDRRRSDAESVQQAALSNQRLYHLPDGPEQQQRDREMTDDPSNLNDMLARIYAGGHASRGAL